jgi:hypothetical protein
VAPNASNPLLRHGRPPFVLEPPVKGPARRSRKEHQSLPFARAHFKYIGVAARAYGAAAKEAEASSAPCMKKKKKNKNK